MNRPKPENELQPIRVISDFPIWMNDTVHFFKQGDVVKSQAVIAEIKKDRKLLNKTREVKC